MLFVINNLKYDTDKMELISEKCEYVYKWIFALTNTEMCSPGKNVKLYKSHKNNYLLTYQSDFKDYAKAITEEEARNLLIKYDLEKYEELFGELEEA